MCVRWEGGGREGWRREGEREGEREGGRVVEVKEVCKGGFGGEWSFER